VQRILDQIAAPATVRNARLDYVGVNALGRALYESSLGVRPARSNSTASAEIMGVRRARSRHR
jgi:hypothetical protein